MNAIPGALCGMTARTGATQPKPQVIILFAAPLSPQSFEWPEGIMLQIAGILTVISPARTADRFRPTAKKMPSKRTSIRREADMNVSMAI